MIENAIEMSWPHNLFESDIDPGFWFEIRQTLDNATLNIVPFETDFIEFSHTAKELPRILKAPLMVLKTSFLSRIQGHSIDY